MGEVAWTAKVKHASRTKCLLEGGKKTYWKMGRDN
jgi:hypothetical protein